jgi:hypothetical protein
LLSGDLGGPGGDQSRVGAGFEGGPVLGEFLVAVAQGASGVVDGCGGWVGLVLGLFEGVDGLVQVGGAEGGGQPLVEDGDEVLLAQVDAAGVR